VYMFSWWLIEIVDKLKVKSVWLISWHHEKEPFYVGMISVSTIMTCNVISMSTVVSCNVMLYRCDTVARLPADPLQLPAVEEGNDWEEEQAVRRGCNGMLLKTSFNFVKIVLNVLCMLVLQQASSWNIVDFCLWC